MLGLGKQQMAKGHELKYSRALEMGKDAVLMTAHCGTGRLPSDL